MNLKDLYKPFPPDELEWRLGPSKMYKGELHYQAFAYITARAIMNRLDDVCGQENWSNEYVEWPGGAKCGISVCVRDKWVTKWDGAEVKTKNRFIDSIKTLFSDSMKRAAVQWGVGRYLYELPRLRAVPHHKGEFVADLGGNKKMRWNPPELPDFAKPEEKK